MAKRASTSDINHDNWDAPFEPEEAGTFKAAAPETLQKRVLKIAKRSNKTDNEPGKSVFANFGGFKAATTNPSGTLTAGKPFGFLTSVTSTSSIATTTTSTITSKPSAFLSNVTSSSGNVASTPQQQYLADLKELNLSVADWIKTHIDSNPLCILTPIFNDYNKHLKSIQEERENSEKADSAKSSATNSVPSTNFVSSSTSEGHKFSINVTSADTVKKTFTFADTSDKKNKPFTNIDNLSVFGATNGNSPLTRDSNTTKPASPSLFSSFKTETSGVSVLKKPDPASLMINPFTSTLNKDPPPSNGSAPSSTNKTEEEENDSEEPPKVAFTPIEEEGSVFSTRCKVFVKKDDSYKDKGVGTLFIKKVGDEKHQLLVRAETVLGNVLVNVLLTSSVPTQRMGKNNVMLVCMPTPQDPPPPTTVLLRVKTSDEADSLLATLEKYKP